MVDEVSTFALKSTIEDEIAALRVIAEQIEPLDEYARVRVLHWLLDKYDFEHESTKASVWSKR